MQNRENALKKWLELVVGKKFFSLEPLLGDASFRRYYRLKLNNKHYIIMDAPPDKEPLQPFIDIANLLRNNGLLTPTIYASDKQQGFAMLDDFGDTLLLQQLSEDTADTLYQKALTNLITLQQYSFSTGTYPFPIFNQSLILNELQLFTEWFVKRYLKISLKAHEENLINDTFNWLSVELLNQPYVLTHRDYHARNIMLASSPFDGQLAIIDFQDALKGPFTYDLVSLLKDCYIQWPNDKRRYWLTFFYKNSSHTQSYSLPSFIKAFDFCGLQRHLKVLGIFCRLYLRDSKSNYLKDLPLTLHYILTCLKTYEELQPLSNFFQMRIKLP